MNILVICNDVVGLKMAGPAIRCVEICKSLQKSFKVTLAAPSVHQMVNLPFDIICTKDANFESFATSVDLLIIQGDALKRYPFLKECRGVLVADLYCPIPLEYHQVSDGLPQDVRCSTAIYLAGMMGEQLAYADHFLCASEKQKDFWLGALMVAGRVNSQRWPNASRASIEDLISLLPFGLSEKRPVPQRRALREKFAIPDDDFVLVWGGGVYQWFDPLTIIKAVHRLVLEGHGIHLAFIGVKHPNPSIHEHDMCGSAVELARDLGILDSFIHFNFGWVDYEDRHNYLLDADVGVSAHFENPETRYSFRTRMLDYLWCSLPIIATKGDFFGDSIEPNGAGVAIGFEDVDGWVCALRKMKTDHGFLAQCKAGSAKYSTKFEWDKIIEPLAKRCSSITPSPDRLLVRSMLVRRDDRPNILSRLRHVYSTGGVRSLFGVVIRKIGRVIH